MMTVKEVVSIFIPGSAPSADPAAYCHPLDTHTALNPQAPEAPRIE